MGKKKQSGMSTENLEEFNEKEDGALQTRIGQDSKVGQGEVDGKPLNWNYNEGKTE